MLIFLDFDGVLHPFLHRHTQRAFCYLPRFENVLRAFPRTKVVVTSTQRETKSLLELRSLFAPDVARAIIGATPVKTLLNAEDIFEVRYREIQSYLAGSLDSRWVALDDDATLFPLPCPNLIVCDDGFGAREEAALRSVLAL